MLNTMQKNLKSIGVCDGMGGQGQWWLFARSKAGREMLVG